MKLASLKHGRDGRLVVVSRDLSRAVAAGSAAPTLQAALDDWARAERVLRGLSDALNADGIEGEFPFEASACAAPLPRAYQWCDGSAYVTHVELVRKARGAKMPPSFWTDPLMYQGASDRMLGPSDPVEAVSEDHGIDLEAEIAVILDDVPMGVSPADAAGHIKLLALVNDVSLRALVPAELSKGFGFLHAKPASSFSPVAVTPDELGTAWRGCKVHLPLESWVNEAPLGCPNAGVDMTFDFAQLISHAARTRRLGAGTIVGSGTVANADAGVGASCLAEKRMRETLETGAPVTPFLAFGDRVRIEMRDSRGNSIFGAIDQQVIGPNGFAGQRDPALGAVR